MLPRGAGCAVRRRLRCQSRAARSRARPRQCPVWQPGLRHLPRFARIARARRPRRRADCHRPELARAGLHPRGQRGQGCVLRKTLHQKHCPEPGPGGNLSPHRPRLPGRHPAPQPAEFCLRRGLGAPGQVGQAANPARASRRPGHRHQRLARAPARTAPRPGGLGPLPRPGGVAPLQQEISRRLQFRKRRRARRRRVSRVGLPLRGPVPMGQRRRPHRAGRIRAGRQGTPRALRQRRPPGRPQ